MDDLDLHDVPNIFIELIHQEIHVEQVIELPAFTDHRITQNVPQLDRFVIIPSRDGNVSYVCELDWGRNEFRLTWRGVRIMFVL